MIESEFLKIAASIESPNPCIPGTLLYNEGWLLRFSLVASAQGIDCLPFRFEPHSRWFSEALLYSAFLPRFRGDPLAETLTHADAVVGQFVFGAATKTGVILIPGASQFVVCEAKIFSSLSQGTKRAPTFDQAARNVGCMAETLQRAGKPLSQYSSLGFFVLAPAAQIATGMFAAATNRDGIRQRLTERVRMYESQPCYARMKLWLQDWALPLMDRMEVGCRSWESTIESVAKYKLDYATSLKQFYRLCLKYNSSIPREA